MCTIKGMLGPTGGNYSSAVSVEKAKRTIYVSGKLPIDANGNIVPGGIEEQTTQVIENIKSQLEKDHLSLKNVVKTTCFLNDKNDFPGFDKAYGKCFKTSDDVILPARSTVQAGIPKQGILIEIECVAVE